MQRLDHACASVEGVRSSETILPSLSRICRRAWVAISGSWVMRMTVRPCRFSAREDAHHLRGGRRVERAGGLVGQDQSRIGDQRSRDRHALLLATGQLGGEVGDPIGQPDLVECGQQRAGGGPRAGTPA